MQAGKAAGRGLGLGLGRAIDKAEHLEARQFLEALEEGRRAGMDDARALEYAQVRGVVHLCGEAV